MSSSTVQCRTGEMGEVQSIDVGKSFPTYLTCIGTTPDYETVDESTGEVTKFYGRDLKDITLYIIHLIRRCAPGDSTQFGIIHPDTNQLHLLTFVMPCDLNGFPVPDDNVGLILINNDNNPAAQGKMAVDERLDMSYLNLGTIFNTTKFQEFKVDSASDGSRLTNDTILANPNPFSIVYNRKFYPTKGGRRRVSRSKKARKSNKRTRRR